MNLDQVKQFEKKFIQIKNEAGTHSPSMSALKESFLNFKIDIDACFLSNPYATDLIMDYLQKELIDSNRLRDVIEHYPSQQNTLAKSFAHFLHVKEKNLFIGNGAIEIIQVLMQQIVQKKVVIPIPTFSSYYEFVNENSEVIYYPLEEKNNYQFNIEHFASFVQKNRADTVILINPNNPNGAYISQADMRLLLHSMKDVNQVIIDESFIHFAYEDSENRLIDSTSLFYEFDNVIIVKSLSKDFGIAGIRLGYALMPEHLVKKLLSSGYLWNINGIAQTVLEFLTKKKFQKRYEIVRKKYILICQKFFADLEKIDEIFVYPSKANFALIKIPAHISSSLFVAALLLEHNIYVRTANDKIGLSGECIRIAVRREEENKQIIQAIKHVITKLIKEEE